MRSLGDRPERGDRTPRALDPPRQRDAAPLSRPQPLRRALAHAACALAAPLACSLALDAAAAPPEGAASATNSDASDDQEYRELIRQAIGEYDAGRFQEALTLFELAYARRPTARVLRGMAKARFELGSYTSAVATLDRALSSEVDPLPQPLRDELRELRERAIRFIGALRITLEPRSAVVQIDGRPLSATELDQPIALDVGKHAVDAAAPGYRDLRRTIEVAGGSSTELTLALEPVRAPAPPPPVVVKLTVVEPTRAPLYVTAATSVVGLTGVVVSTLWFASRSAAVDTCAEAARLGARCANASEIATGRDASMWALGGSAAVAAGAGIAFAVLLSRDAPGKAASAACRAGLGHGACALQWSF